MHDFGTAWSQAADGKPTHIGLWFWTHWFDFPSQKIGFNLLMVKVRRFDVGCTNGVLRFAYHLMRMVLTVAQRGSIEENLKKKKIIIIIRKQGFSSPYLQTMIDIRLNECEIQCSTDG